MRHILILTFLLLTITFVNGQIPHAFSLENDTISFQKGILSDDTKPVPIGNGISDLLFHEKLYMGTSRGVSVFNPGDESWIHYDKNSFRGKNGITALNVADDGTIWVATGFDTTAGGDELDAGGGLFYKAPTDENWAWISQPVDPREGYDSTIIAKPTTTNVQNVTYDLEIHNDEIWIASWGGGIRKSEDNGQSWTPVTPDGRKYDVLGYESHRGFSLLSENENMWVGTAGGLGKINVADTILYTYQEGGNSISGNWIIGIYHQETTGWVWAVTLRALDSNEKNAISATPDGGETWYNFLVDELGDGTFARYMDFSGDSVFVASEKGIYFSPDRGTNWNLLGYMVDENSGDRILSSTFYSCAVEPRLDGNRFWFGSSQGLISTTDLENYKIYRRYAKHEDRSKPFTFAYPSPFSPRREQQTRIQFYLEQNSFVKVGIYNFAMEKVVELSENVSGVSVNSGDRFLVWDGKDASGNYAANGIYMYKLKIGSKTWWGKIAIVN